MFLPCESSKSNLQDIQADPHEVTKHFISPHVQLVHHEVRANDNQILQRELAENGHHLASLPWLQAPCDVPLDRRILRKHGQLMWLSG
jgi:hypothetical protein